MGVGHRLRSGPTSATICSPEYSVNVGNRLTFMTATQPRQWRSQLLDLRRVGVDLLGRKPRRVRRANAARVGGRGAGRQAARQILKHRGAAPIAPQDLFRVKLPTWQRLPPGKELLLGIAPTQRSNHPLALLAEHLRIAQLHQLLRLALAPQATGPGELTRDLVNLQIHPVQRLLEREDVRRPHFQVVLPPP